MTAVPATMRQIYFDGGGGPDVIRVGMAPVPQPTEGKALIEVVAAGVNRPDCLQREGNYPPPPGETNIPGLEIAGRVVALGPKVTTLKLGDAVCALVGSGGYADYALADAALCLPIPKPLTITEAAGVPETFFTVYDNVFTRGRLKAGETFLVHGGSGGIGTVAIQLAKLFGARVITTAGSAEKCAFCRTIGADLAIDYKTQDFVEEVKKFTEKRGANLVLDMVGGSYIQRNLSALGLEGRLVQIAFQQAHVVESFNFMPIMLKRLAMMGSTLRSRSTAQKAEVADALREKIWPLLDQGKAKPIIHATFPLEDARAAHELMESSNHVGKILLLTGK
jgi:putative PIG3 family NAD(P)H quinone oxidoreductase